MEDFVEGTASSFRQCTLKSGPKGFRVLLESGSGVAAASNTWQALLVSRQPGDAQAHSSSMASLSVPRRLRQAGLHLTRVEWRPRNIQGLIVFFHGGAD